MYRIFTPENLELTAFAYEKIGNKNAVKVWTIPRP